MAFCFPPLYDVSFVLLTATNIPGAEGQANNITAPLSPLSKPRQRITNINAFDYEILYIYRVVRLSPFSHVCCLFNNPQRPPPFFTASLHLPPGPCLCQNQSELTARKLHPLLSLASSFTLAQRESPLLPFPFLSLLFCILLSIIQHCHQQLTTRRFKPTIWDSSWSVLDSRAGNLFRVKERRKGNRVYRTRGKKAAVFHLVEAQESRLVL